MFYDDSVEAVLRDVPASWIGHKVISSQVNYHERAVFDQLARDYWSWFTEDGVRTEANFVVWVGGVEADYYMTKEAADLSAQILRNDGYDDVAVKSTKGGGE
jgi:hypothetical protein